LFANGNFETRKKGGGPLRIGLGGQPGSVFRGGKKKKTFWPGPGLGEVLWPRGGEPNPPCGSFPGRHNLLFPFFPRFQKKNFGGGLGASKFFSWGLAGGGPRIRKTIHGGGGARALFCHRIAVSFFWGGGGADRGGRRSPVTGGGRGNSLFGGGGGGGRGGGADFSRPGKTKKKALGTPHINIFAFLGGAPGGLLGGWRGPVKNVRGQRGGKRGEPRIGISIFSPPPPPPAGFPVLVFSEFRVLLPASNGCFSFPPVKQLGLKISRPRVLGGRGGAARVSCNENKREIEGLGGGKKPGENRKGKQIFFRKAEQILGGRWLKRGKKISQSIRHFPGWNAGWGRFFSKKGGPRPWV